MPTSSRSANMWQRLVVLVAAATAASSAVVKYDQSQTGDYNVHLDLKNVEVLAFLDESSLNFGEYEYDYGDLTVKPPPPPTGDTLNVSSSEASVLGSTEKTPESGATTGDISTISPTSPKPARRCGAGFYRDSVGRCRRQRRPIKLAGLINQAKNQATG